MGEGKKRSINQIRGEKGINILKALFPNDWVVREFVPDYGIDLDVELFEKYDEETSITKGEHLLFQVKTSKDIPIEKMKIKNDGKVYKEIEVVKYKLETSLIATVERMSAAVPVILAYVDESIKKAYFVCVNDYIEKIIIPENVDYEKQDKKTINIPVKNQISVDNEFVKILEFYGKRSKLFALFNKIYFQREELKYIHEFDEYILKAKDYAKSLLRLDAWNVKDIIEVMGKPYSYLNELVEKGYFYDDFAKSYLESEKNNENIDVKSYETDALSCFLSLNDICKYESIKRLWDTMANFAGYMDTYWVNWFLPTYLGITLNE